MSPRRVHVARFTTSPREAVREALLGAGILEGVGSTTRVCIKPNLTYPYYKEGVTTSPAILRETILAVQEHTRHVAIVETDGGYGAWSVDEAFRGHGLHAIAGSLGPALVNLCEEEREYVEVPLPGGSQQIPLPRRLLHETDLLISMPVPKIHAMTGVSLAYKNQWGCVPDTMRLRMHHCFDQAIVRINQLLKPRVLADGTYFLDGNGPLEGFPRRVGCVIGASDAGAFDCFVSTMMGVPWRGIGHLRHAVRVGDMPSLDDIEGNVDPHEGWGPRYRLNRTWRNYLALAGFRSRFVTWLGYESWFGRVVLHAILYAIAGRPVKPAPADRSAGIDEREERT